MVETILYICIISFIIIFLWSVAGICYSESTDLKHPQDYVELHDFNIVGAWITHVLVSIIFFPVYLFINIGHLFTWHPKKK